MTNKTYDILKFIAQILLPALGTLYVMLASPDVLGLPYAGAVVGTITAVDFFLGTLLGISTSQYNKEIQVVSDSEDVYNENESEVE